MSRSSRREFLGQLGSAAVVIPGFARAVVGRSFRPLPGGSRRRPRVGVLGGLRSPDCRRPGDRPVAGRCPRCVTSPSCTGTSLASPRTSRVPRLATCSTPKTRSSRPGLIDLHSHVYEYGTPLGTNSDRIGNQSGVTTIVDCGSTGASMFPGFRRFVIDGARTRIYALLNISTAGCCTDEIYLDPRLIDTRAALGVIEENRDLILGIKVRVRGRHDDLAHDISIMKTAREIADANGMPIMMHWSTEPELLAIMKSGDILTHPFNPPNRSNIFGTEMTQADTVLPQILELRDRGIYTDGQLGTTHHQWEVSEKATSQGWFPDAISTDLARKPRRGYRQPAAADVAVPAPGIEPRAGDRARYRQSRGDAQLP